MTSIWLDTDKLKPYCNLLLDVDIELELLPMFRLYSFKEEDEPFIKFCKLVLNKMYNDDKERDYTDVFIFYKEQTFITQVFTFLARIEILLLSKVERTDIVNIIFDKMVGTKAYYNVIYGEDCGSN